MPTRERERDTEYENGVIIEDKPKRNGSSESDTLILPLHVEAGRLEALHDSGELTIGELEMLTGGFEPSQTGDAVRLIAHFLYEDGHYLDTEQAKRKVRRIPTNQLEHVVRELGKAINNAAVPLESKPDSDSP